MLVLHGSDLQVGRPFRPVVAEAFLALEKELHPDLVVVSGDLTQRAKSKEFEFVRGFLESLDGPVVVTPGNHDVPLFRVWERLVDPYRNWRRHVSPNLDSVTQTEGATVVALNSSAPRRTLVAGRIDPNQVDYAARAFVEAPAHHVRIVVIHHHFLPTPDRLGGSPLPRATTLLEAFEAMGVDLILGGHVHQTHLYTSRSLVGAEGPGIPLLACGTTASSRGRGPEADGNSLNVVRIMLDAVEVVPHLFEVSSGRFQAGSTHRFPRPRPLDPVQGGGGA